MIIFIYIVSGLLVLLLLLVWFEVKRASLKSEKHVLKFILQNPKRSSFFVIENGKTVVNVQSDVKRPLASVVKIMVLAEFVEQVTEKQIDPNEIVSLESINRFYIPNSDGGAHPKWLYDLKEQGLNPEQGFTIIEVARGMMSYSSNANTEFLMERLGLDAINSKIQNWQLQDHDPLFPFSSAILMPTYLMDTLGLSIRNAGALMRSFSYDEYATKSVEIFGLLREDREGKWIRQLNRRERSKVRLQRIWSEKFPRSTVKEYARLLYNIHEGKWLKGQSQLLFLELMNVDVKNKERFVKAGVKGGSSLAIINQTLYSEDVEGNKLQIAMFVHDPFGGDQMWLEKKSFGFLNKYVADEAFKKQVNQTLRKIGTEKSLPLAD